MDADRLANWERRLRPFLTSQLPPTTAIKLYSRARAWYVEVQKHQPLPPAYTPIGLERTLWGITFRSPLMNAAGMFKNGEGYRLSAYEGAGAYLGGTGTWDPSPGFEKDGIRWPFVPYPRSGSASNALGFPNDGDNVNVTRVPYNRINGTPVGWSVMSRGKQGLAKLVNSMNLYCDSEVDFLEVNLSCPMNDNDELEGILQYVKERFIDRRYRNCPVVGKITIDTPKAELPRILDLFFKYRFDGINIGNSSTDYEKRRSMIDPRERVLYDYFTKRYGGGISGKSLKYDSLELSSFAVEYASKGPPDQEFNVIRTGGIEGWKDIEDSEREKIKLNQWLTGYRAGFDEHRHDVYKKVYNARFRNVTLHP